ncbi:DUF5667 domain-containing protein [Patescibacteria group bacterium]|nr:DUF5667 domain-containing protein [Patescibacteria group bacterium]
MVIKYIKFKVDFLKARKLLKSELSPDREFLRKARKTFIANVSPEREMSFATPRGFSLLVKYVVVGAVVLGLSGTLVTFAQSSSVYPTHPLYPFKILGENVALAFSSNQNKPYLHKTFAKRRLEEIKTVISKKVSTDKMVGDLDKDFKYEINEALSGVESDGRTTSSLMSFCSSFGNMIIEQREMGITLPDSKWSKFEKDCGGTPSEFKIELE